MNILITGGTGFIGSRLALKCLELQHTVRVLGQENTIAETQNRQMIENRGADIILDSVTNRERMIEICDGIDWVFHLAAAQHEANVPDQHFKDINIHGTHNLLEASKRARVQRFIHGSTIGVYGTALDGNINENSPLKPNNIYGITKLEGERLVESYADNLSIVIIRISETYGPGDRRLLKLFKAVKKNMFFVIGNGKNLHHLVYIDDLISGMLLAASSEAAIGKIFLFAGKEPLTTVEMVQEIARHFGTKIPKLHAPLSLFLMLAWIIEGIFRPLGIQPPLHRRRMDFFRKSFYFSLDHAYNTLDYKPMIGFAEGVKMTADWYENSGLL